MLRTVQNIKFIKKIVNLFESTAKIYVLVPKMSNLCSNSLVDGKNIVIKTFIKRYLHL